MLICHLIQFLSIIYALLFVLFAFKFRRLWQSKHRLQQQAASTTVGGKDKCYSLLVLSFSPVLSRHLPTLFASPLSIRLSIYLVPSLSISLFHFSCTDATRRDATAACACTRASDVGSTRRTCHANATPIYTRSLCFSFFLSHSFNTINLSVRHSDLVAMCARK